jgi:hypothetical protein
MKKTIAQVVIAAIAENDGRVKQSVVKLDKKTNGLSL